MKLATKWSFIAKAFIKDSLCENHRNKISSINFVLYILVSLRCDIVLQVLSFLVFHKNEFAKEYQTMSLFKSSPSLSILLVNLMHMFFSDVKMKFCFIKDQNDWHLCYEIKCYIFIVICLSELCNFFGREKNEKAKLVYF